MKHEAHAVKMGDGSWTVRIPNKHKAASKWYTVCDCFCNPMTGTADLTAIELARLLNTGPALLAALQGLLEQATGPVMVHGDGRGNDGKKTGLSGDEFNALKKSRLEAARAAIAQTTKP